jgi:hypothetical protein
MNKRPIFYFYLSGLSGEGQLAVIVKKDTHTRLLIYK